MDVKQFKLIRLYLAMSQKEFAEYIGVGSSSVARLEAGYMGVSDIMRSKVLRKFDVTAPGFTEFCRRMGAEEFN